MKYSWDTFRLYKREGRLSMTIRISVMMKRRVDRRVLDEAVNRAIVRYPYYAVAVTVDEEGGYVLVPNHSRVVVMEAGRKVPGLGSKEVNGHLLFVDCHGRQINFYISHSLCGGKGVMPWVMTSVYEYVALKYHVQPDAPAIRRPGEPLLPAEDEEPGFDILPDEEPIYHYQSKKPVTLLKDYIHGLANPFCRCPNYYVYSFSQKDLMAFARNNDASIAAFFLVAVARTLDKVLPQKARVIGGEIAHNPTSALGLENSHFDLLSHVHIDYDREQLQWDMEKLCTMTRGQIILQTDPSVSSRELRDQFTLFEQMDQIKGLKNKIRFMNKHNPATGGQSHGTYIVNYTGQVDWGELADYVDYYVAVVEGHLLLEITSMKDRIFVSWMQLLNQKKYTQAFEEVLKELDIPFQVRGPFAKRMTYHRLEV